MSQLLEHERIETTLPKAKELRKVADKMVTLAKQVREVEAVVSTAAGLGRHMLLKLRMISFGIALHRLDVFECYTLCKPQGTLFARRQAAAVVRTDEVLHKLFTVMAQRYANREGGYTRLLRSRRRTNDAAQMAYIECVLPTWPPLIMQPPWTCTLSAKGVASVKRCHAVPHAGASSARGCLHPMHACALYGDLQCLACSS